MNRKIIAKIALCSIAISSVAPTSVLAKENVLKTEEIDVNETQEVNAYSVNYTYDATQGSVVGKKSVDVNEDIDFYITPAKHYKIQSVTYTGVDEDIAQEANVDAHGYVNIPAAYVSTDMQIDVAFEQVESYTITQGSIAQGHLCAECTANASAHQEGIDYTNVKVQAGSPAVFVLYSQNWSGGDEWYLTDVQINDETVNVPMSYYKGDSAQTTMKNGSTVTVRLEDTDAKDPHVNKNKRYKYIVTISEAQANMVIDANFKKDGRREVIFKGLNGIEKTAASTESRYYKAFKKIGYHYDYSLTVNTSQIYKTYNQGDDKSRNIYAYTLKPGYNPETVTYQMFYDGTEREQQATQFGVGSKLLDIVNGYKTNYRHFDSFIANMYLNGFEYGFALKQHSAHNQQCYLNADPYQYTFSYQLNGGEFVEGDLNTSLYAIDETQGYIVDSSTYTIENETQAVYMPMERPVKEGYVFNGWKLVENDKVTLDAGKQFILDATSINSADTTQTFHFEAMWSVVE